MFCLLASSPGHSQFFGDEATACMVQCLKLKSGTLSELIEREI